MSTLEKKSDLGQQDFPPKAGLAVFWGLVIWAILITIAVFMIHYSWVLLAKRGTRIFVGLIVGVFVLWFAVNWLLGKMGSFLNHYDETTPSRK